VIHPSSVSVALTVLASPLSAQALSVLVGGVHAEYADSLSGTAAFVSTRLSVGTPTAAGFVEGSLATFATGEWAVRLEGYGTAVHPVNDYLAAGIAAGGQGNNSQGGTWSGSGGVGPVLVTAVGPVVTSLAVAVGGVRRVDETSFATGTGNFRVRGFPAAAVEIEGGLSGVVSATLRYLDATMELVLRGPRLEVGFNGGARSGDLTDGAWASARAQYAITPLAAVEAAVGRYPQDLTGFTDGVFGTLGVRLNLTAGARAGWGPGLLEAVQVDRLGSDRVRVLIRHTTRDVDRVEIAGDWNDWLPELLDRRSGGRWSVDLTLQPGVYKFALILNGEEWTVPQGAPSVPDDFGGEVALLVVQ
jgi:hypothetical protein